MLYSAAASLVLAGLAVAAPTALVAEKRATKPVYEALNITYSSPVNKDLPNVLILATGGTIAGASSSSSDATHYAAGVVGVAALVEAVPQLLNVSNIDGIQFSNVKSGDFKTSQVLQLSKVINYALCSENSTYTAAIVTHGTDTLEETAFTLDITVNCKKPVVVVGAMRPSTATSADGPGNLLEAVTVAVDPRAAGRGALIVLNDRIGQAWYTIKRDADVLDTFGAPQQGYVGQLLSFEPLWYNPPSEPSFKRTFDVSYVDDVPAVEILYCHESWNPELINYAIEGGAKGLVLAGTGSGDTSSAAVPYIAAAVKKGIPVVVSTKINVGVEVPTKGSNYISAGLLNPVKSRIQLGYALANGLDMDAIRDTFEGVLAYMIGYGTSG